MTAVRSFVFGYSISGRHWCFSESWELISFVPEALSIKCRFGPSLARRRLCCSPDGSKYYCRIAIWLWHVVNTMGCLIVGWITHHLQLITNARPSVKSVLLEAWHFSLTTTSVISFQLLLVRHFISKNAKNGNFLTKYCQNRCLRSS